MRTIAGAFAIAAALVFTAAALAQDNPIARQMDAFKQAYNSKDATAISAFYTEAGALLPPQSKALLGRDAIAAHYKAAFDQGVGPLDFRILEISQVGPDTAVLLGETSVKAGPQTIHGRSMHLWRRLNDTWLIDRDMYHVLGVSQ